MQYEYSFYTDVGMVKKVNQDSCIFKMARMQKTLCLMACVCDGVGGLSMGEIASKEAIVCLAEWFDYELPQLLGCGEEFDYILKKRWENLIQSIDRRIKDYGNAQGRRLGTTLSCLLILDETYYFCHVGDSRIYCIDENVHQLTTDHTFLAQEVRAGRMTQEEANNDSRQNLILQCVGAGKKVEPEIQKGRVRKDDIFLICSDGFRHKLSETELGESFSAQVLHSPDCIKRKLMHLTELVKKRGEKDNITAMVIKAVMDNENQLSCEGIAATRELDTEITIQCEEN